MNHLRAEVIICPNVLLEDWGHYDTNSTQALISLKIWTASQPVTFLHVHHVSMQRLWNAAFWSLFFAIIPIIWKRSWSLFYWLKLLIHSISFGQQPPGESLRYCRWASAHNLSTWTWVCLLPAGCAWNTSPGRRLGGSLMRCPSMSTGSFQHKGAA